ncbi:SDR family NAD(P)-dependent oxidoreductase [Rhodobacteraceae bacterium CCMM004]|nr:SDR family NAD(P)-dependent oxidoreductase [Rhodobacteraceae bacterium CCMM004]
MSRWRDRTYWLVGASEGLGRALAERMSRAGADLVLSARSADRLEALAETLGGNARAVPMDVSDDDSVARAAEAAGDVHGVVYIAGVYWPQPATEWVADEVTTMFDVNLTGAARVFGRTVPQMVARNSGHVVAIGSLSGYRGLPGSIGYSSSKAGLMHLAESMHADLKDTGVRVQLANLGFIRTRLTQKNDFKMPMMMEPEEAARGVFDLMESRKFKATIPASFGAMFRASALLPDALYYKLFS